ncbi:hypothetical protein GR223_29335 [Rhizobium leguminosarum]|uniref:hypothetical protein n=1 Tax=Rhizobium ruizarguesonis TaxID=2081791 RepID=UPI0013E0598D|nr:hypothetical protein [Rhizobium ruizarguesonis]NEJ89998.1 hypothetical protein [Rhizobium ruizarguesonis]
MFVRSFRLQPFKVAIELGLMMIVHREGQPQLLYFRRSQFNEIAGEFIKAHKMIKSKFLQDSPRDKDFWEAQENLPRDASGLETKQCLVKDIGFDHNDESLVIHLVDGASSRVILEFDVVAIQGFIEEMAAVAVAFAPVRGSS